MEKYWFIYAYPAMYGGLHGIYDYEVVKCNSYEEAFEYGMDMAREVIERYGLEKEIYSEEEYMIDNNIDYIDDEYYSTLDDAISQECEVEVYRLKDDSYKDIIIKGNDDVSTIIKNYCERAY